MALHPICLRQHSEAYSDDCEHYADRTCCAWDRYVIAPKANTQGDSLRSSSQLEERRLHLMRILNEGFWHGNMDTHIIGIEQSNSHTQNGKMCVKCHVSGLKETYL